jgi:hypothetical protein
MKGGIREDELGNFVLDKDDIVPNASEGWLNPSPYSSSDEYVLPSALPNLDNYPVETKFSQEQISNLSEYTITQSLGAQQGIQNIISELNDELEKYAESVLIDDSLTREQKIDMIADAVQTRNEEILALIEAEKQSKEISDILSSTKQVLASGKLEPAKVLQTINCDVGLSKPSTIELLQYDENGGIYYGLLKDYTNGASMSTSIIQVTLGGDVEEQTKYLHDYSRHLKKYFNTNPNLTYRLLPYIPDKTSYDLYNLNEIRKQLTTGISGCTEIADRINTSFNDFKKPGDTEEYKYNINDNELYASIKQALAAQKVLFDEEYTQGIIFPQKQTEIQAGGVFGLENIGKAGVGVLGLFGNMLGSNQQTPQTPGSTALMEGNSYGFTPAATGYQVNQPSFLKSYLPGDFVKDVWNVNGKSFLSTQNAVNNVENIWSPVVVGSEEYPNLPAALEARGAFGAEKDVLHREAERLQAAKPSFAMESTIAIEPTVEQALVIIDDTLVKLPKSLESMLLPASLFSFLPESIFSPTIDINTNLQTNFNSAVISSIIEVVNLCDQLNVNNGNIQVCDNKILSRLPSKELDPGKDSDIVGLVKTYILGGKSSLKSSGRDIYLNKPTKTSSEVRAFFRDVDTTIMSLMNANKAELRSKVKGILMNKKGDPEVEIYKSSLLEKGWFKKVFGSDYSDEEYDTLSEMLATQLQRTTDKYANTIDDASDKSSVVSTGFLQHVTGVDKFDILKLVVNSAVAEHYTATIVGGQQVMNSINVGAQLISKPGEQPTMTDVQAWNDETTKKMQGFLANVGDILNNAGLTTSEQHASFRKVVFEQSAKEVQNVFDSSVKKQALEEQRKKEATSRHDRRMQAKRQDAELTFYDSTPGKFVLFGELALDHLVAIEWKINYLVILAAFIPLFLTTGGHGILRAIITSSTSIFRAKQEKSLEAAKFDNSKIIKAKINIKKNLEILSDLDRAARIKIAAEIDANNKDTKQGTWEKLKLFIRYSSPRTATLSEMDEYNYNRQDVAVESDQGRESIARWTRVQKMIAGVNTANQSTDDIDDVRLSNINKAILECSDINFDSYGYPKIKIMLGIQQDLKEQVVKNNTLLTETENLLTQMDTEGSKYREINANYRKLLNKISSNRLVNIETWLTDNNPLRNVPPPGGLTPDNSGPFPLPPTSGKNALQVRPDQGLLRTLPPIVPNTEVHLPPPGIPATPLVPVSATGTIVQNSATNDEENGRVNAEKAAIDIANAEAEEKANEDAAEAQILDNNQQKISPVLNKQGSESFVFNMGNDKDNDDDLLRLPEQTRTNPNQLKNPPSRVASWLGYVGLKPTKKNMLGVKRAETNGGSRRRLLSGKRRATRGGKKAKVNRTKKHPRQKKRRTNTRRKRS